MYKILNHDLTPSRPNILGGGSTLSDCIGVAFPGLPS
jgi:hypothetical protein